MAEEEMKMTKLAKVGMVMAVAMLFGLMASPVLAQVAVEKRQGLSQADLFELVLYRRQLLLVIPPLYSVRRQMRLTRSTSTLPIRYSNPIFFRA